MPFSSWSLSPQALVEEEKRLQEIAKSTEEKEEAEEEEEDTVILHNIPIPNPFHFMSLALRLLNVQHTPHNSS